MATEAARQCLERRGLAAEDVDLIIVGTVTPDMHFPASANLVQDALGATKAWGFDLSAACSGLTRTKSAPSSPEPHSASAARSPRSPMPQESAERTW